jgi:hypothetical protein
MADRFIIESNRHDETYLKFGGLVSQTVGFPRLEESQSLVRWKLPTSSSLTILRAEMKFWLPP